MNIYIYIYKLQVIIKQEIKKKCSYRKFFPELYERSEYCVDTIKPMLYIIHKLLKFFIFILLSETGFI